MDDCADCMSSPDLLSGDLSCYKPDIVERRLQGFLARVGAGSYLELWQLLRDVHLPRLKELAAEGELRARSAGCRVGAEAYSLAVLLEEVQPPGGYRILATE